jgi:hypothetical protein
LSVSKSSTVLIGDAVADAVSIVDAESLTIDVISSSRITPYGVEADDEVIKVRLDFVQLSILF